MRARLARYSVWQLRDYVFERGLPSLIVTTLVLLPIAAQFRAMRAVADFRPEEFAGAALAQLAPTFGFFVVLLAVNGIISNDRKSGAYRLLFARPISIGRFYAQAFVVNWIGAMLVTGVMLVAFSMAVHPVAPGGLFAFVSLYYVALGGLGFLFSSVARLDWTLMAGALAAAVLARAVWPPEASWYGRVLDVVLPPLHRVGEVGTALVGGADVPATTVLWLAAYGTAAFVLGLVVLRVRAMAD